MVYIVMKKIMMTFGNRLTSIRKERKVSQSDLGIKAGVHANLIGRYERDEAIPSVEVAGKIADALSVSLDYLSELSDTELDSVLLSRINEINSLSDEEQKQIFTVVDALIRDYKAKKAYSK